MQQSRAIARQRKLRPGRACRREDQPKDTTAENGTAKRWLIGMTTRRSAEQRPRARKEITSKGKRSQARKGYPKQATGIPSKGYESQARNIDPKQGGRRDPQQEKEMPSKARRSRSRDQERGTRSKAKDRDPKQGKGIPSKSGNPKQGKREESCGCCTHRVIVPVNIYIPNILPPLPLMFSSYG